LGEAEARSRAEQAIADPGTALGAMVREEGGIDPEDLAGSPVSMVASAFLLFAAGAILPLLPFFVFSGTSALVIGLGFGVVALFGIGAALTIFTGRDVLFSGVRQAAIGLGLAAIGYGVGALFTGWTRS
jgi:VIT1/CCC1 family predicted Fe2+/Mn2+ transporter